MSLKSYRVPKQNIALPDGTEFSVRGLTFHDLGTLLEDHRDEFLAAGQIIGESDFVARNGDLGTLPATILMDAEQAIGRTVRIGVAPGQPLRSDQLTTPWAVQQGQTVKTVSRGTGFSVNSEGKALNNAQEGQVVQVRTPSGQTVSGIARPGGVVEITY